MFPSFPLGATPRPDQRPASSFPGGIAWAAALCTRASVACWRKSVWKRRTNGQQSNAKTPEGREKEQTSNQTLSEAEPAEIDAHNKRIGLRTSSRMLLGRHYNDSHQD
eukprot:GHVT01066458.1.p2 GENE.GHVT01066458.1~~GHVT01066458.1.p2  ORF type:complete len:108 (-),score=23.96 GHVT01066458.1:37-360(-)